MNEFEIRKRLQYLQGQRNQIDAEMRNLAELLNRIEKRKQLISNVKNLARKWSG